jgi:hypothetical protein
MAIPPLVGTSLPLGRWHCEMHEVESTFVNGASQSRQQIWKDWVDLTTAVRATVGEVAACWLSGSFLTDKSEPADIDCVYIIRHELVEAALADVRTAWFLQQVATSGLRSRGVSVDSYVLPWAPQPGVQPITPQQRAYLAARGYWDDLWGRMKDPEPRMQTLPRRGYLEVNLDGYR